MPTPRFRMTGRTIRLPGFVGPSYESEGLGVGVERTVNLIPEVIESPGAHRAKVVFYQTPGFDLLGTLPERPCRGIINALGRVFVVAGTGLYEFTADGPRMALGAIQKLGTVPGIPNPVKMTHNGDGGRVLLIAGGETNGYYFDLDKAADGTPVDVFHATPAVENVDFVGFIDGYFVGLDVATSTLRVGPLYAERTIVQNGDDTFAAWDPTQFAQRSTASDQWKSMFVIGDEIFLLGSRTTDVYVGNAGSGLPFLPDQAKFIDTGILLPDTVARMGHSFGWVASSDQGSGMVVVLDGYSATRVSTHAVELAIERAKSHRLFDKSLAWSYEQKGHSFYVLELPDETWTYDQQTGQWSTRGEWNPKTDDYTRWRARYHAAGFQRNIVCDSQSGRVGSLTLDSFDDVSGRQVHRMRRAPHMTDSRRRIWYDAFELDMAVGVGSFPDADAAASDVEPEIGLRYSDDNGYTWSGLMWQSLGKLGDRRRRIRWTRLGSSRDRVFEVRVVTRAPVRMFDAFVTIRSGR